MSCELGTLKRNDTRADGSAEEDQRPLGRTVQLRNALNKDGMMVLIGKMDTLILHAKNRFCLQGSKKSVKNAHSPG